MKLLEIEARFLAIEAELATIRESRRVPPRPLGPWSISDRMPRDTWLERFVDGGMNAVQMRKDLFHYVLLLESHVEVLEKMVR